MGCCIGTPKAYNDGFLVKKKLNSIYRKAETGDLFLSSGRGKWSDAVRLFSGTRIWSHVGIFIVRQDMELLVLDVDAGNGVKLLTFDDYVALYNGYYVGLRKLEHVSTVERMEWAETLLAYAEEIRGLGYSKSAELARSVVGNNRTEREKKERMFCIEMVVEAYKKLGIIEDEDGVFSNNSQLNDVLTRDGSFKYFHSTKKFEPRIYVGSLKKQFKPVYYVEDDTEPLTGPNK